jgi:hypothetical protein
MNREKTRLAKLETKWTAQRKADEGAPAKQVQQKKQQPSNMFDLLDEEEDEEEKEEVKPEKEEQVKEYALTWSAIVQQQRAPEPSAEPSPSYAMAAWMKDGISAPRFFKGRCWADLEDDE